MAQASPCDWAACAKDKKGQTFTLTPEGGAGASAELTDVKTMDIGGGYVGYTFSFTGTTTGCGDGMYAVSGGGCDDSELFFVVSDFEGNCHYVATITCQS